MIKKEKYGLIGYPLSHSFSPAYFDQKFQLEGLSNVVYSSYEIKHIANLFNILPKDIKGFNVTIPHKETIIPYLDHIDVEAQKIGAVNTVKIQDGKTIGYNTDVNGFSTSLSQFIEGAEIHKALILGTGGAAKAIAYALRQMDISYTHVSRKKDYLGYHEIDKRIIDQHQLIINTTPLGTFPLVDECPPIPYHLIGTQYFLFDLVYNPEKTLFLRKGEQNGAKTKNGYEMLVHQAELSWKIWNQNKQ